MAGQGTGSFSRGGCGPTWGQDADPRATALNLFAARGDGNRGGQFAATSWKLARRTAQDARSSGLLR